MRAARALAITLSPAYATRVADRHWQRTAQTHRSFTVEDFEFYHQQVRAVVQPQAGERIADFGCGEGSIALALRGDGFDVVGADISLPLVDLCRRRGLECYPASQFLAAPERFDVIFLNGVFLYVHPRRRRTLLTELRGKLVAGGRLYILDEPDLAKRHLVSANPLKRLLWAWLPVYEPGSAGFFNDMSKTSRLARSCGFGTSQVLDSWSEYRSHLVLGA